MTESGKTLCAQKLCAWYRAAGIKTCVLDPMRDPAWQADFLTDDPDQYFSLIMDPDRCVGTANFVDESGLSLDKYAVHQQFLTCQSRHHGMVSHIIAQRAQQVGVTTRAQCGTVFAFQLNPDDAKQYARDFNAPILLKCPDLPQGQCIRVTRFQRPELLRMW
jgi:hypothetical protein